MKIRTANSVVGEVGKNEVFYIWVRYRGWVPVKKEKEIDSLFFVKEVGGGNGYRVFYDDLAYIERKDK